ncbi:MAG: RICIN domain-containing protein, partial [Bacteroidota bacterium]
MITFSHSLKHYCFSLLFCIISIQVYAQNPVKDGQWYTIESNQRGLVLQVQPPYENNGVAVILAKRTRQDNQLFRFEAIGNGYYKIRSKKHNKCFDIRGGSMENGGVLQVWDQANVENQKFKLDRATADNQYYITAKHSNKSIAAAASFPRGSTITQQYADGLANAMFKFIPHKPRPPKPTKPSKPTLLSPVSGKKVENKKGSVITFVWNKVPNASSYQLIVQHKSQKNTLFNNSVNGTRFSYTMENPIEASLANDQWRWWVRAKKGNTWSEWSTPNMLFFTTPKRTSITLTSPFQNGMLPNGIENTNTSYTWNFDWLDVPNAEQYEILISHPNDASKSLHTSTPVSYYQLTQRVHYKNNELRGWNWKVRVFRNGSYSQWSTPRTFNVIQNKQPNNPTPVVVTDNFATESSKNFNKAIKNNFAVELTNKVNNRSTSLGYNVQQNLFKMNEFFKNW